MSANATLTNINATESIQSTTNPLPTGDLVTSSISETFTSDVLARQNVDQVDTCLIEYPLWRSGDNCMDKQLTENILFGLSIGKSLNPQYPGWSQKYRKYPNVGNLKIFIQLFSKSVDTYNVQFDSQYPRPAPIRLNI